MVLFICSLSDEFIDRFLKLFERLGVIVFYSVYDAGRKVFLQDDAADRADRGLYRRQLDQDFRAVSAAFYHSLGRLHVADDARKPVQNSLGVFR